MVGSSSFPVEKDDQPRGAEVDVRLNLSRALPETSPRGHLGYPAIWCSKARGFGRSSDLWVILLSTLPGYSPVHLSRFVANYRCGGSAGFTPASLLLRTNARTEAALV